MRRVIVLGFLIATGALSLTVAAFQQPPAGGQQAPMVVEIDKLKDNLFVMKGGGGNSSVFITAKGVVARHEEPGWGQPLLDAIKKVTEVTMIVNTHTHGDHVSGNISSRPKSTSSRTRTPPRI